MDKSETRAILSLIASFKQEGERGPKKAIDRLVAYGKRAVPHLITALESSPSAHMRAWSATALAEILGRAALPYLLRALADPNMSVRLRGLQAIARFNDPELAKVIVPLLKDPSGGVRMNALEAIVKLGVPGVETLILAAAEDEKWYIRQRAVRALDELHILAHTAPDRARGDAGVNTARRRARRPRARTK